MESPKSTIFIVLLAITALIAASFGALGGVLSSKYLSFSSVLNFDKSSLDKNIVRMIEDESSAITVVDRVAPAVVSIVVKQKKSEMKTQTYSMNNFFYGSTPVEDQGDPNELIEVGAGTGFFVTDDGYIVTNRHVAGSADYSYFVLTNDDQEFEAKLIDADPFFDIAILKIEGQNFPIVTLGDSDGIQVGQTVIAIGNALSQYQNSVTKGVISGINRRISAYDFTKGGEVIEGAIQTDAAINPGNSGGPLINLMGEVIGMNTAINSDGQGLGFAIPINEVKSALAGVQKEGRIVRPWIGVRFLMLSKEFAEEEGLSVTVGALITAGQDEEAVVAGSPAEKAGLKNNDIVISVNDEKVTEENSLSKIIREYLPGDTVKLIVSRDGTEVELSVTLEEYKESE